MVLFVVVMHVGWTLKKWCIEVDKNQLQKSFLARIIWNFLLKQCFTFGVFNRVFFMSIYFWWRLKLFLRSCDVKFIYWSAANFLYTGLCRSRPICACKFGVDGCVLVNERHGNTERLNRSVVAVAWRPLLMVLRIKGRGTLTGWTVVSSPGRGGHHSWYCSHNCHRLPWFWCCFLL